MKDRKKHVINKAHELFIKKGFSATSIQDIIEYSGISKGTFYNYFSTKNELLKEIFKYVFNQLVESQNEIVKGQDPQSIEVFSKQIELQMETIFRNKLLSLYEEMLVLNDNELRQIFNSGQLKMIYWLYQRLIDIFGESKKPYLLDCAIMFTGILNYNMRYYAKAHHISAGSIHRVVKYSINRLVNMVEAIERSNEQLFSPKIIETWFPENNHQLSQQYGLLQTILELIRELKELRINSEQSELLNFIYNELLQEKKPRRFLIKSALDSLKDNSLPNMNILNEMIMKYLSSKDELLK